MSSRNKGDIGDKKAAISVLSNLFRLAYPPN